MVGNSVKKSLVFLTLLLPLQSFCVTAMRADIHKLQAEDSERLENSTSQDHNNATQNWFSWIRQKSEEHKKKIIVGGAASLAFLLWYFSHKNNTVPPDNTTQPSK